MAFLAVFALRVTEVEAQSFFANLGADPAAGVDRGPAALIRGVDRRTGFLTFSAVGAEDIGPYIASATLAWPDLLRTGDQMDVVLVLGGLSDNGGLELAAAGIGNRQELPGNWGTLYFNADQGEFELGSRAYGARHWGIGDQCVHRSPQGLDIVSPVAPDGGLGTGDARQ